MTIETDHLKNHAEEKRELTILLTSNIGDNLNLKVSGKLITDDLNAFGSNISDDNSYEVAAKRDQYAMHDYPEGLLLNFEVRVELIDSNSSIEDLELALTKKKRSKKYGNHEGQFTLDFAQETDEVIVEDGFNKDLICKNSNGIINLLDEDCSILDDFLRVTKKKHFVNRIKATLQENGIDFNHDTLEFKVQTPNLH